MGGLAWLATYREAWRPVPVTTVVVGNGAPGPFGYDQAFSVTLSHLRSEMASTGQMLMQLPQRMH